MFFFLRIRRPPSPALFPYTTRYRSVVVVGRDPGARCWTTPEAAEALAAAANLVGYGPYLNRVPANPRQTRHPSDNRVEAERDRKSTRLNSSHANISYAVFCLKKNN